MLMIRYYIDLLKCYSIVYIFDSRFYYFASNENQRIRTIIIGIACRSPLKNWYNNTSQSSRILWRNMLVQFCIVKMIPGETQRGEAAPPSPCGHSARGDAPPLMSHDYKTNLCRNEHECLPNTNNKVLEFKNVGNGKKKSIVTE